MDTMKKNLRMTSILLIVAGTINTIQGMACVSPSSMKKQPPGSETHSLTITANNINGAARGNAEVKLYNAGHVELVTVIADSEGKATFSNLVNGTYSYKVYYQPSLSNVPVAGNKEFWGGGTINLHDSNVTETFTRNAPYISGGPTFHPGHLSVGQPTAGSFKVKNPLSTPVESYVAIWVDRNRMNNWDYSTNNSATAKSIDVGETAGFSFNVIPVNDGSYSCYAFVYTKIDGTYMITDQYNWVQVFSVVPDTTISQIEWSGYTWKVRSGVGGPGPNHWAASRSNIWVDDQGNLHLKIIKKGDKWYCSEIFLPQSLGYGEYTFEVSTNVETLDKNIVFGLFTYETDSREIDIEFSKWGNAANVSGWYSVQPPPFNSLNQKDFALNLSGILTTHQIKWDSSEIYFRSDYGHGMEHLISHWTYKGANNPPAGKEKLHLNVWLLKGNAPSNLQETEVVIKSFRYVPKE